MQEFKYVIVREDFYHSDALQEVKVLLSEGWQPLRETPMPSSGDNRAQPPTCLVVMTRDKN